MSQQALTYALTLPVDDMGPRFVLVVLSNHVSNETGKTIIGQERLCDELKCSPRSLQRYLAVLEKAGHIRRSQRQKRSGTFGTNEVELVGYLDWLRGIEGGSAPPPTVRQSGVRSERQSGGRTVRHLLADGRPPPVGGRYRKPVSSNQVFSASARDGSKKAVATSRLGPQPLASVLPEISPPDTLPRSSAVACGMAELAASLRAKGAARDS